MKTLLADAFRQIDRLSRLVRPTSVRGRYLVIAGMFIVLLTIAVAWANLEVNRSSRSGIENTRLRQDAKELLQTLRNQIWSVETSLHSYMLLPNPTGRNTTEQHLRRLHAQIGELYQSESVALLPESHRRVEALTVSAFALDKSIHDVMDVRVAPWRLYPATSIMNERMLIPYTEFYSLASLAIDEAENFDHKPGQRKASRAFLEARHASTQMIMAFRTYVAYRFDIFSGTVDHGMDAQRQNILTYSETATHFLKQLQELDKRGQLEFQQQESLEGMVAALRDWMDAFAEVRQIYESDNWRTDVPLLSGVILPQFATFWDILDQIDKSISVSSAQDMGELTRITDWMSRSIWFIASFGIVFTILGFLLFEITIRRPVSRVAQALKNEAEGKEVADLPQTGLVETETLISAFGYMRRQVHSRQLRLETILDNAAEGIITFDIDGRIEAINKAAENLFGYNESDVFKQNISILLRPLNRDWRDDYVSHFMRNEIRRLIGHEGELVGRHADGSNFPMAIKISQIELEGRTLYTALVSNISERKAMMERLQNMADHDALTGLHNRAYFQEQLNQAVERSKRGGKPYALLYIDLDNFKYINDTLGHAAGDRLLIEVTTILKERARKSDLLARFGGDEFTALLFAADAQQSQQVAEAYRDRLANHIFKYQGEVVYISCSIGVSMIATESVSGEEVLSRADIACHLAKRAGRNRVHVFNSVDEANVTTMSLDMGWSRRIKNAIAQDRLLLASQPIVSTHTGDVACYEILVRMLDENNEIIMPGGFLPSAERFGLAGDIDRWVIGHAIEVLSAQRKRDPKRRFALNLSGQTLTQEGAFEFIRDKLTHTGVDPTALTFEVTESVAIADMVKAETLLSRLRALGCRTSLDDFGAGLSSFAYLKDLPVDEVKIDGRFVKSMANNPMDQAMVKAMSDIAHALNKRAVAEFVEDAATVKLLAEFGVDYAQGYYLGRPELIVSEPQVVRAAAQK